MSQDSGTSDAARTSAAAESSGTNLWQPKKADGAAAEGDTFYFIDANKMYAVFQDAQVYPEFMGPYFVGTHERQLEWNPGDDGNVQFGTHSNYHALARTER